MEVIWIGGPSAIGKLTLFKRLVRPTENELRARLGMPHEFLPLGYVRNSDEITLSDAMCVLAVWQQSVDSIISRIHSIYPDVLQRGVLLWRPTSQHFCDYVEKKAPRQGFGLRSEPDVT